MARKKTSQKEKAKERKGTWLYEDVDCRQVRACYASSFRKPGEMHVRRRNRSLLALALLKGGSVIVAEAKIYDPTLCPAAALHTSDTSRKSEQTFMGPLLTRAASGIALAQTCMTLLGFTYLTK